MKVKGTLNNTKRAMRLIKETDITVKVHYITLSNQMIN